MALTPSSLELRQPSLHRALRSGDAQAVKVLMLADALELHALPLRVIPVVERELADPEGGDVVVDGRCRRPATLVTNWYMLGVVGSHSLGFATGTSKVKPADAPAAMLWAGVVTGGQRRPGGAADDALHGHARRGRPLLTTVVVTCTVAAVAVGAGVVTKVAY